MAAIAHHQTLNADLQDCAALDKGVRHRSIMSRVCGVEGVVSLQPDMTRRYLYRGTSCTCPTYMDWYEKDNEWDFICCKADH